MPHPSVAELSTACACGIGQAGAEMGSNINGAAIGHSRSELFFAAGTALDVPVFVHALKPAGMDRLVGPAPLQQVRAYPTHVDLAAASVTTGGLMLSGLQQGWDVCPTLKHSIAASPVAQARRMFYDTWVFDTPTLGDLVQTFGGQALAVGNTRRFLGRAAALPVALSETA